jgi:hypothetical protein
MHTLLQAYARLAGVNRILEALQVCGEIRSLRLRVSDTCITLAYLLSYCYCCYGTSLAV